MSIVFADTAFWLALLIRSDQWHESAINAYNQLNSRQIVTTELVLIELLDGVSRLGTDNRDRAVAFVQELHNDGRVKNSRAQYGNASGPPLISTNPVLTSVGDSPIAPALS